ncbi:MAG: HEAT repeat domain-containing protein [Thermostichales cyanobacterium SZTDM-1c_bins_54]
MSATVGIGSEGVNVAGDLMALLASEDLGDNLRAVNQARYLQPEACWQVLSQAAQHPNARVRYAAISQMGSLKLADPAPIAACLRQALQSDPEFDVRAAAAASLGDLKYPNTLPDLMAAYAREQEWLVQFSIMAALGELRDPGAFDLIASTLESGNELVRTAAIAALGDLGDERAIPKLAPWIRDPDWQLRYRLAIALGQIGTAAAQELLQQLSQDPDPRVAQQASALLQP